MKLKKTQISEMLGALPPKAKLEVNLMLQCHHQRGILKLLPDYLQTLQSNKITSEYIYQFQEESHKRNQSCLLQREEAIAWFEEKIQLLKGSQWAEHSVVKYKIERVEAAMQGKSYNLLMRAFFHVWDLFKEAAYAVAAFGYHPLFDGWAKVEIYTETICNKLFNSSFEIVEKDRWKYAIELGRGFISHEPSSLKGYSSLSQGIIREFSFPRCVEVMLAGNQSQEDWKIDCKSDPTTLFIHLQLLSQYLLYKKEILKPLVLPLMVEPKTLIEVDDISSNGFIGLYLSRFDAKKPERHPASLKELKDLIITFSTMLGTYVVNGNIPQSDKKIRKPRDEARVRDAKIAQEWMKKEWDGHSEISKSTMIDKLRVAIALDKVKLEGDYKSSTLKNWAFAADPYPEYIKRSRPRTPNREF